MSSRRDKFINSSISEEYIKYKVNTGATMSQNKFQQKSLVHNMNNINTYGFKSIVLGLLILV